MKIKGVAIQDPQIKQKQFQEFSRFLNRYLESRTMFQKGHVLEAYGSMLEALRHWAKAVIIDAGLHPEKTAWEQVRRIQPGVYKLYEEYTQSSESLEKKVQLLLLGLDFSALSKIESCCAWLLDILKSRKEPWSVSELMRHPDLADLGVDLSPVLKKLVQCSLVKEVAEVDETASVLELKYTIPS